MRLIDATLRSNSGDCASRFVKDSIYAVTAGGLVRVNVCFTVRAADLDSGLLLFDNQSRENDRVYFALR